MPQDPLQAELIKRSWANPANRPPRDVIKWKQAANVPTTDENSPEFQQRLAVEDAVKTLQPEWNITDKGGLMPNGQGGLSVVTDPLSVLDSSQFDNMSPEDMNLYRYALQHPEKLPHGLDDIYDLLENPDEDSQDNRDQSLEETLTRRLATLQKLIH